MLIGEAIGILKSFYTKLLFFFQQIDDFETKKITSTFSTEKIQAKAKENLQSVAKQILYSLDIFSIHLR